MGKIAKSKLSVKENRMGEVSKTRHSSFLKFLNEEDFASKLQIPSQFPKNHGETLPKRCSLKSDDRPGKLWRVSIDRVGEQHFFADGWDKFAEGAGLKLGQYLLFVCTGKSVFEVSTYEITGCKKETYSEFCAALDVAVRPGNAVARAVKIEDEEKSRAVVKHEKDFSAMKSWRYCKKLTKYDVKDSRLTIPRRFALSTGIAKKRVLNLRDANGRQWLIRITDRKNGSFTMSRCRDFMLANNFVVGSTISFAVIPGSDNVIQARVLKL